MAGLGWLNGTFLSTNPTKTSKPTKSHVSLSLFSDVHSMTRRSKTFDPIEDLNLYENRPCIWIDIFKKTAM